MAKTDGVETVARALKVNRASLSRRMGLASPGTLGGVEIGGSPTFIDGPAVPELKASAGCVVEFTGCGGSRVTLSFSDARSVDFAQLSMLMHGGGQ